MLSKAALILAVLALPAAAFAQTPETDPALAKARALLKASPIIDGHNDVPWHLREHADGRVDRIDLSKNTSTLEPPMQTDIARLRAGGVGGQFWSVYIPASVTGPASTVAVLKQMDIVRRMAERYPDDLQLAFTADEVRAAMKRGRIASLMGIEGGYAIDDSLEVLRGLYAAGARYMTLTHSTNTNWADSATDAPDHGGLTPFGEEVVREMNRIGMLVDLSHVSAETMKDAIGVAEAPVIFSHSSARGVAGHARNVPDDVLALLLANGGVVMVTFVGPFVSEELRAHGARAGAEEARLKALNPGDPKAVEAGVEAWRKANPAPVATIAQVADHIDRVKSVAGADHVGIGGDYDGTSSLPEGLGGVDGYPQLIAELVRRGWSDADIKKLTGGNILRVMRQAEAVAAKLQAERPASQAVMSAAK